MFRVKICGITRVEDARVAVAAGADAVGLNFYSGSPRCCSLEQAATIAAALPANVRRVGVFVDSAVEDIRATAEALRLDAVQLHGNEPPEILRQLLPLPTIKVFRLADDFSAVGPFLQECHKRTCMPRMVLVDALRGDAFGGTGKAVDWGLLEKHRREFAGVPLVLAGGLTPENVTEAIAVVRPWAVDTASGVEQSPGIKSADKIHAFVASAIEGFARLQR